MQTSITIDDTLQYTKGLKLLYVEDDLELQESSKELFKILFQSVTTVNDGEEALKKYNSEHFDIIISDIKMPKLNGIELTKAIREIDKSQYIIITSAYNDAEYLMEFINLNIKQFIQKPINIDNMLEVLYFTSKNIVNQQMVEQYRRELESNNKELAKKNEELQSLVRILDAKILQISKESTSSSHEQDINLADATIKDEHLNELKELEIDISGAAVLISLSKNLSVSNIEVLGEMFLSYAEILASYDGYVDLSNKINELGNSLNNAPENFIKRVNDISTLLESFIYVLRMWRKNLVNDETQKAFDLHASMINDITTIISIIDGTENEIETEMEFF